MTILTITLNPAFDDHIYVENFKAGAENYAIGKTRQAGGKGVNISRALVCGGIPNTALVLLGRKGAEEFMRCLKEDGVYFRQELTGGAIRENITIHCGDGSETRISLEGTGISDEDTDKLFSAANELCEEGAFVAFAGRMPSGIDRERLLSHLDELSSRGARLCVDSNSLSFGELVRIKPWLIKPNEFELASLCGRKLETRADFADAAQEFIDKGVKNVVVSLGSRGALLIGEDGRFAARPPRITARSTIGAGDSTLAGFIAAKTAGKNGEEALAKAIAYGSAKCLREGTLPPRAEDIAQVMTGVKTERF